MDIAKYADQHGYYQSNPRRHTNLFQKIFSRRILILQILAYRRQQTDKYSNKDLDPVITKRLIVPRIHFFVQQQINDRQRSENDDEHRTQEQDQRTNEHPELPAPRRLLLYNMRDLFIA